MISGLKEWVMSICTAIFFITAVEMIMPNNSMKKYSKFVLGLILITVVLNPIIKIFDKNFNINGYVNEATKYFEEKQFQDDYDKYKNSSINNTVEVFSDNLENLCVNKLEEKFPRDSYEVSAQVSYDTEKEKFIISEVRVGVNEGNIRKVKKIKIKDSKEVSSKELIDDSKSKSITEYLNTVLNIPKDKIKVYKM